MYMLSNILFIVEENALKIEVYRIENVCKKLDEIEFD